MAVILTNTLSILIAYWSRRWLQICCVGGALRFQVHSSALLRMNWPEREDSVALQSRAEASCPQGRSANGTWVKITLHSVQPCLCRFGNKEAMIRQPSGGEERRRRQGRGGNAVWNRDESDRPVVGGDWTAPRKTGNTWTRRDSLPKYFNQEDIFELIMSRTACFSLSMRTFWSKTQGKYLFWWHFENLWMFI